MCSQKNGFQYQIFDLYLNWATFWWLLSLFKLKSMPLWDLGLHNESSTNRNQCLRIQNRIYVSTSALYSWVAISSSIIALSVVEGVPSLSFPVSRLCMPIWQNVFFFFKCCSDALSPLHKKLFCIVGIRVLLGRS